jgi:ADP-heptose:LPS heptosyltransferase
MSNIYIEGMSGIGDNIIQRCFIKQLTQKGQEVWIKTPLPEIYEGLSNIHYVRAYSKLRTQKKNENITEATFESVPYEIQYRSIFYGDTDLKHGSIFNAMERRFGIPPAMIYLPKFFLPDIGLSQNKPIALIRPTTERIEWHNSARGPLNEYVDCVAKILAFRGWHVISIADTEVGLEWITDAEPFAHQKLHHGELTISQMFALVQRADIVVSGVGVVMLAAIAYKRPTICLQGGCGGNNHHSKVTDNSCMDLSQMAFIYPDNYCRCQAMKHNCNKFISNLPARVTPFIERVEASIEKDNNCGIF